MRISPGIMIVGTDEQEVSVMRFVIGNNHRTPETATYTPMSASTAAEAIALIEGNLDVRVVILMEPLHGIQKVIDICQQRPALVSSIVLTTNWEHNEQYFADACLTKPSMAELLEKLKVVLYRKRGPRPKKHCLPQPDLVAQ